MNGRRGPRGGSILRLYPTSWRRRYEPEMLALLEDANLGARAQLDLARGALDAWFQASTRVAGPAALVGGGLWTIAGVAVVGQATPPDWPGYLIDVLPMNVAAIAFGLSRLRDEHRCASARVAITDALFHRRLPAGGLGPQQPDTAIAIRQVAVIATFAGVHHAVAAARAVCRWYICKARLKSGNALSSSSVA